MIETENNTDNPKTVRDASSPFHVTIAIETDNTIQNINTIRLIFLVTTNDRFVSKDDDDEEEEEELLDDIVVFILEIRTNSHTPCESKFDDGTRHKKSRIKKDVVMSYFHGFLSLSLSRSFSCSKT